MSEQPASDACAALVRKSDPDRYFAALFAPADVRGDLFTLYALNHEIARIADSVREPMLGLIRLQWWRETIEGARAGNPRRHEVAEPLAAVLTRHDLPQAQFEAILDARQFDVSDEDFADMAALETYVDATSGNVMRLAARVLGSENEALAKSAGLAFGLSGMLRAVPHLARRRKFVLPRDLADQAGIDREAVLAGKSSDALRHVAWQIAQRIRRHMADARRHALPKRAAAAFLPAALVPLYMKRLARAGFDPFALTEVPIHRRQMRLLAASLRGRV